MTPLESIFEIRSDLLTLQQYLQSKDVLVVRKARIKYEKLVDRFFREHGRIAGTMKRDDALANYDQFLRLLDSAESKYYCD